MSDSLWNGRRFRTFNVVDDFSREIFETLDEVKTQTETWLAVYNDIRPHDSLGGLPPGGFMAINQTQNVYS